MNILLTGTRAPATLDLARRLNREGARVIGADSMRFPIGRFSNAFAAHYRVPSPRFQRAEYFDSLLRILADEEVTLLWPTCEEVFHVAARHEEISDHVRLLCDPLDRLEPLHHKLKFARLAGDAAPASWSPEEAPVERKLVWKPCYSRFAARLRMDSPPASTEGWMAQEFVPGEEFSSWALCLRGEVRTLTFYDCPARAGRGAGCAFEPLWDDSAAVFVENFAASRAYTGSLAFDFVRGTDGRFTVIECNSRLTSGLHVLDESVRLLDLLESRGPTPPPMVSSQLKLPTLFTNPFVVGTSPDIIYQEDDRSPALGQIPAFSELAWNGLRRCISLRAASTRDIEFNGD